MPLPRCASDPRRAVPVGAHAHASGRRHRGADNCQRTLTSPVAAYYRLGVLARSEVGSGHAPYAEEDTAEGAPPTGSLPLGWKADMPEQLSSPLPMRPARASGRDSSPSFLWAAVVSARAALADERNLLPRPPQSLCRGVLLEALEAYVRSLGERGHPTPYALRDELRLLRLTDPTIRRVHRRSLDVPAQERSPR